MQNNPELKKVKTGEENGIKRIDFTKTYTPQTLSFLPLANRICLRFITLHFMFKVYVFTFKMLPIPT